MDNVTLGTKDNSKEFFDFVSKIQPMQVYVGIPEATSTNREQKLLELAGKVRGKSVKARRARRRLAKLAEEKVTNAGLLFIHTKGSQLRNIPARPVLEPAIEEEDNKDAIAAELEKAALMVMDGKDPGMYLHRAGLRAQRAAQKWFTDPRNGWAPNTAATIRRKGSDRPLIDTGAMRQAITYVVKGDHYGGGAGVEVDSA